MWEVENRMVVDSEWCEIEYLIKQRDYKERQKYEYDRAERNGKNESLRNK